MSRVLEDWQQIERSIIKKFRRELWNPFIAAVKRYKLVEEGDRIAVCISGGKDSMLMAKLMQELSRHSDVPFETVFLVMDPGYSARNREKIEQNARRLRVPITVFESNIFEVTESAGESPCYLCARMRRGFLYSRAQELGCNKIALGHHLNDVIETPLISMLYGGQLQGMLPKLHSTNFPGMALIRPLYCVREEDIIAWAQYNGLGFIQCACRFTEKNAGRLEAPRGKGVDKAPEARRPVCRGQHFKRDALGAPRHLPRLQERGGGAQLPRAVRTERIEDGSRNFRLPIFV